MPIPAAPEIIRRLGSGSTSGETDGFAYALDLSHPIVTTAIHAGHEMREELGPYIALSEAGRLYEEDPFTDQIISTCPNRVWGLSSRCEYDLNRSPDQTLPESPARFWGKSVYKTPLPETIRQRSLKRYHLFYRFMAGLIQVLLERFGCCVVYDIHSYNISRQVRRGHPAPPEFNLGTASIDRKRWEEPIEDWLSRLREFPLPDRTPAVAENDVFQGKGHLCRELSRWSPNVLVLPTEISKFYMDEQTGVSDRQRIQALRDGFSAAIHSHGRKFRKTWGKSR